MKKITKQKLGITRETIATLDPENLTKVAGGAYTCGGSMCGSCSYVSAASACTRTKMTRP